MTTTKVYLVGGPEAAKENSWDLMTNSQEEAFKYLEAAPDRQIKVILVKDKGDKGGQ